MLDGTKSLVKWAIFNPDERAVMMITPCHPTLTDC